MQVRSDTSPPPEARWGLCLFLPDIGLGRLFTNCRFLISRLLLGLLLLAATNGELCAGEKQLIGWIERVAVTTEGVMMEAKIDTGADYSSVDADDIRYFMREGVCWVEFSIKDRSAKKHVLRRPLMRMSRIKKKTMGFQDRPVVKIEICVGDQQRLTQVNLAERGHFKYPLLLGRDFLGTHYLVDPASKYLQPLLCH